MLEIYTKEGWLPITNGRITIQHMNMMVPRLYALTFRPVMKCTGISLMKHQSEMKRTAI